MANKIDIPQEFQEKIEKTIEEAIHKAEEVDKCINCKNVEFNPIHFDPSDDVTKLVYLPYCLARKEVILDPTGCKNCDKKVFKFNVQNQ